jgi:hypothetical protein
MSAARVRNSEAGFTITELLMAATLMLVIVGATMTAFGAFERNSEISARQNDAQEKARATTVTLARQLRNLAGPDNGQPQAFDKATDYDVVFKSVNPEGPNTGANRANVYRVRYCLEDSVPGRLWMQRQTWVSATVPNVPSTGSCPGSGWNETRPAAEFISNRRDGQDRPAFLYSSSLLPAIDSVRTDLFIDLDLVRAPRETRVESGVFLRNQNRPPTAAFQWTPGGEGRVLVNGSLSEDPEGENLRYTWKEGDQVLGQEVVLDLQAPGTHTITLQVHDPAGLEATQTQTVTVS